MSHLIISEYGRFLGKKSERLAIFEKGKVIEEYPLGYFSSDYFYHGG